MLSVIIALTSLFSTFLALSLAFRVYRKAPPWIDEKIEGFLSTFLQPDEEGKNLVDHLADRFGRGFRMSLLSQKSGEVRHEKMLEKRVFDAAMEKSPEMKIGMQVLDKLGLGDLATPENIPALFKLADKYGLLGMLKGNSPGSESSHGEGVM